MAADTDRTQRGIQSIEVGGQVLLALVRRRSTHADAPTPGMSAPARLPRWREFERQLEEVRAHGLSRSVGEGLPGVNAMAAPVFDHAGAIVLCFTAIGPAAVFDTRWDGALAWALRECAEQVSQRLGAPVAGGVRS